MAAPGWPAAISEATNCRLISSHWIAAPPSPLTWMTGGSEATSGLFSPSSKAKHPPTIVVSAPPPP